MRANNTIFTFLLFSSIALLSMLTAPHARAEIGEEKESDLKSWPPLIDVPKDSMESSSPIYKEMLKFLTILPNNAGDGQPTERGSALLTYVEPESAKFKPIYDQLSSSTALETMIASINRTLYLRGDMYVTLQECHEKTAFYDPEYSQVVLCYELIDSLDRALESKSDSKENESKENANSTIALTLLLASHETGHALIDQLALPTQNNTDGMEDDILPTIWNSDPNHYQALTDTLKEFLKTNSAIALFQDAPNRYWKEANFTEDRRKQIICSLGETDSRCPTSALLNNAQWQKRFKAKE